MDEKQQLERIAKQCSAWILKNHVAQGNLYRDSQAARRRGDESAAQQIEQTICAYEKTFAQLNEILNFIEHNKNREE